TGATIGGQQQVHVGGEVGVGPGDRRAGATDQRPAAGRDAGDGGLGDGEVGGGGGRRSAPGGGPNADARLGGAQVGRHRPVEGAGVGQVGGDDAGETGATIGGQQQVHVGREVRVGPGDRRAG